MVVIHSSVRSYLKMKFMILIQSLCSNFFYSVEVREYWDESFCQGQCHDDTEFSYLQFNNISRNSPANLSNNKL